MDVSKKMAGKATRTAKATAEEKRRQRLIQEAAWRHAVNESAVGQSRAVEGAVAEMIGASRFIALRLGDERTRQVVAELLKAI
jgi:hypothetical protein